MIKSQTHIDLEIYSPACLAIALAKADSSTEYKKYKFSCNPPTGGRHPVKIMFVYAIYNRLKNKIYIGSTDNLERRLIEHNRKLGKHFTSSIAGNWELIYKEEAKTRNKALIREKQLKSYQGRLFIKRYIPL